MLIICFWPPKKWSKSNGNSKTMTRNNVGKQQPTNFPPCRKKKDGVIEIKEEEDENIKSKRMVGTRVESGKEQAYRSRKWWKTEIIKKVV